MAEYTRPAEGFRFLFGGVNTKEVADALPADKYQAVLNVRATAEQSIRTRPGYNLYFTANNSQNANNFTPAAITDMRAYTALGSNAFPRMLARDANGRVFLDTNAMVGNLAGNAGYGVSMNPFRPRESAQPWMYIAGVGAYQRFSAPDANNNVVQANVGIAEPQVQIEAGPNPINFQFLGPGNTSLWPAGGNNTSVTIDITRSNASVAVTPVVDPVVPTRQSLIISGNNAYGIGQVLQFNNGSFNALVDDVIPAMANGATVAIGAIKYQDTANNTGNCTIFVGQLPFASVIGGVVQGLRRGAVFRLNTANNGGEFGLVLDVVVGANGIVTIDTSTTQDWTSITPKNITFNATLVINSNSNAANGVAMISTGMSANLQAGLSTITHNMAGANSFATVNGQIPTEDDYVHLSVMFSDPTQLIQLLLLFYLDTPPNFGGAGNILYYAIRPSDLVQVVSGNQAIIPAILDAAEAELIGALPTGNNIAAPDQASAGNNMWSEIWIPVSSLQRIGSDLTKSLPACSGVQFQVNVAGNTTFGWSSFWNGAGSGPDVGNNGEGYRYLVVPFNSNTGVEGNPTALMKYDVGPRRQTVLLPTANLNTSYDPQINALKIFRYGGSILTYRFLGTTPTGSNFVDTFFDDTPAAGDPVVIDNTQPWPTIDQPWKLIGNANAYGQFLVCTSTSLPASMNRWLPGTLFQVGAGQDAFTLRSRPVVAGNGTLVTFEFEECVGAGNQSNLVYVLEPNIANQPLPYVWGPNEYGDFFGCGDPYRPGCVYWCKSFGPDAVPTKNNLEIVQPAEPLLGGQVIKGVSLCASSKRWWVLNYQSGSDRQRYVQVEVAVGKRLAAPFGMASDGTTIYFWADDCIAATQGGQAESLTDLDLYNLFPHAGLKGVDVVRAGVTFYAPDYSRAAQFRLVFRVGWLLALYLDTNGNHRCLVYDTLRKAWSQDTYAHNITSGYNVEQPKSNFVGAPTLYPGLFIADNLGHIWQVKDLTNDGVSGVDVIGTPISPVIATREFNAGDARSDAQFGDLFLDAVAPFGMNATPIVQGQPILDQNNNVISTVIAANNNRQFVPISLAGSALANFMGLKLGWTDNYYSPNNNTVFAPTTVNLWQPSYVDKPETTTTRFGDTVDFGQAFYVRGATIYADTMGANKSLKIRNMDNNTLVPLQSVASNNNTDSFIKHTGEQEINYWFNPPFVAHMVREEPQDAVPWRKFKIDYQKDPWPELTDLPSPWMNIRDTGQAGFLQGLILPVEVGDSNNNSRPSLKLRVDTSGELLDLIPFVTPIFNVKTGVAYALTEPVTCHQAQIIPQQPCRVWWSEIQWKAEATPDMGTHWITQWTGFGIKGFKSVPKCEGCYTSQSGIELHIEVQDGTAPAVLFLPATAGGAQAKFFVNLTFNKGQLFRFRAISDGPFQLFMEDFFFWVCEWGRLGNAVPFKLGAEFGDQATI